MCWCDDAKNYTCAECERLEKWASCPSETRVKLIQWLKQSQADQIHLGKYLKLSSECITKGYDLNDIPKKIFIQALGVDAKQYV